ncbi:hypothetical protein BGZ58_000154 [Dissophora ornata]|nr:hypothetical protein BGZ58_000154 [Dissophora ornata]
MFDHPLLTSRKKSPIQYQPLVRWVDIPTKVMSAQRISSIIAGLTNFMDLPKATHRLKLRALGATLAVLGNISMDDIKVHVLWSHITGLAPRKDNIWRSRVAFLQCKAKWDDKL